MILSFFVKQNGNCELRSVECAVVPEELVALQTELTGAGFELSDSSEYTAQLLNGAKSGMCEQADLDAANAKIAELEGAAEQGKLSEEKDAAT